MMTLLLVLAVANAAPTIADAPLRYVRSGRTIAISVDAPEGTAIMPWAYGVPMGPLCLVRHGTVQLQTPDVRTRTLLELRAPSSSFVVAKIAVYPDDPPIWRHEDIDVYTLGTAPWFLDWSDAIGMDPVACSSVQDLLRQIRRSARYKLIILGRQSSIKNERDALNLSDKCDANALILDAAWYGRRLAQSVAFNAKSPPRALVQLGEWSWHRLPRFPNYCQPGLALINRHVVAQDGGWALMEMFQVPGTLRIVVASYVPWSAQLGRNDDADALFAATLNEVARIEMAEPFAATVSILGAADRWPDANRPVLSCVPADQRRKPLDGTLQIVDLRGPTRQKVASRTIGELIASQKQHPVLILGDDPVLRVVRGIPEPDESPPNAECIWLRSDKLPPSIQDQLALIRVLTRYHVPIATSQEEGR